MFTVIMHLAQCADNFHSVRVFGDKVRDTHVRTSTQTVWMNPEFNQTELITCTNDHKQRSFNNNDSQKRCSLWVAQCEFTSSHYWIASVYVCVPWVNANNLINNCPNKNLCVYACSLQYYIQLIARIRRQRVRWCCYRCCGCCCFFSSSFEWTCFFVYNTNTRAHTQNVIKTLNEPISVKQLKSIAYFLHWKILIFGL